MPVAIALLEFGSIALGIEAGDAMVKRAPLDAIYAGTVQPGKYLVLVAGDTASVEEAVEAGLETSRSVLVDRVMLPDVHPDVVAAVVGGRGARSGEALGVIATASVAAVIEASDAAVKGAEVTLDEVRMADGLGGKGYALFSGSVSDVEAAIEIGSARLTTAQVVATRVISQLHGEMNANLEADAQFDVRRRDLGSEGR